MKTRQFSFRIPALISTLVLTALGPSLAIAHCDSMDGPVVKDAERALDARSLDPVLKWVRDEDL